MPRVLVVDDEPTVRAMVVRILQDDGCDVVAVADGAAGFAAATQGGFDLVITNDCMPRMSGDELTARLRQQCPDLPILHISGRPHEAAEHPDATEHYLYKPFGPDALQHAVRALVAGGARR